MSGYSALHAACRNGHDKCASLLLHHIADPNIVQYKWLLTVPECTPADREGFKHSETDNCKKVVALLLTHY